MGVTQDLFRSYRWPGGEPDIPCMQPPDAPPGTLTIHVGMYTLQPGTGDFLGNVPLLDADAATVGLEIALPAE